MLIKPFTGVVVGMTEILAIHLCIYDCEAVSSQSGPQRKEAEDEYLIATLPRHY